MIVQEQCSLFRMLLGWFRMRTERQVNARGEQLLGSFGGTKWVLLPREKMHRDTWGIFRASNRSGVWKTSSSGTPYFLAALRKDWRNKLKSGALFVGYFDTWTFSISKNAGPFKDENWFEIFPVCDQTFSLNFLTLSGLILFIRRQRTTPFWRTSAKSPSGSFSSRTASIHWSGKIDLVWFN